MGGGVGLVSALRLSHWRWCRIGECAVARASVVAKDWLGAAVHSTILHHQQKYIYIYKYFFKKSCFFVVLCCCGEMFFFWSG